MHMGHHSYSASPVVAYFVWWETGPNFRNKLESVYFQMTYGTTQYFIYVLLPKGGGDLKYWESFTYTYTWNLYMSLKSPMVTLCGNGHTPHHEKDVKCWYEYEKACNLDPFRWSEPASSQDIATTIWTVVQYYANKEKQPFKHLSMISTLAENGKPEGWLLALFF